MRYYGVLFSFMGYTHDTDFPLDHMFSEQQMIDTTPEQIFDWVCVKTYGHTNLSQNDNPYGARAVTIEYWKKSIPHPHPETNNPWTAQRAGNPCRSKLVDNLIKAVRLEECRKMGKKSRADRGSTDNGYKQIWGIADRASDEGGRVRYKAWMAPQPHPIAKGRLVAHVGRTSGRVRRCGRRATRDQ